MKFELNTTVNEFRFTGMCNKGHSKIGYMVEDFKECPVCKILKDVEESKQELIRVKNRLHDTYRKL